MMWPRRFVIWEQGYSVNGNSCDDEIAGVFWAWDFDHACRRLAAQRYRKPEGWGPPSYHRVENGVHIWWGCAWYQKKRARR